MAQREWVEKDFYKELGVSSDASADEIKRAYRKLARDLHPDTNPDPSAAADRFKAVSEAHSVLSDPAKRKEYDETRRLFAGGGFGRGRFNDGNFGGFGGDGAEFNLNDLFDAAGQTGGANIGDLFGGLFGRGAQPRPSRPRRGNDLETETELSFMEATKGVAMPLRLTSPGAVHELPWQRRTSGHQPEGVSRTATGPVSSAAIRVRSGFPNRAPSAVAAARSSSTHARSAKAPA